LRRETREGGGGGGIRSSPLDEAKGCIDGGESDDLESKVPIRDG
jgi:hypothetical protein